MTVRERALEIVTAMIDASGLEADPEEVTTAVLGVVREKRGRQTYGRAFAVLQDLIAYTRHEPE